MSETVKSKFVDRLSISLSYDPMDEKYIRVFDLKQWLKTEYKKCKNQNYPYHREDIDTIFDRLLKEIDT